MSYGFAGGLQARVYQRLIEDAALSALVGGAVYDAPLEPALAALGPSIGPPWQKHHKEAAAAALVALAALG